MICSNNLNLNIVSGINQLTWATAPANIQSVSVLRNQGSYVTIPGAPTSFDDVDITCKTDYCYQVVSNYTNGAKSISFERCGTSFTTNTPTPINNVSSVVSDQGVELTWIQDPPDQPSSYRVLRSSDKQNYTIISTVNDTRLNDQTFTVGSNYSYRIDYTDDCDNESPAGGIVSPTQLAGSMDDQNVITLNWSRYLGWSAGVKNYLVQKLDKAGALIKNINVGTDTTLVDNEEDPKNQVISYRVRVVPNQAGISPSISNMLTFTKENHIFFPTAFTPNGDKLNDMFSISGKFIVSIELSIFNRWGELVYTSSNNEPWDGTYAGARVQEDAYVWSANITDLAGRTFKRSGTVALMRVKK
jgi:gliding motility-associated-like protein